MSEPNICICAQVVEEEIVGWIERGVDTVEGLGETCGVGLNCGDCVPLLEELIEDFAVNGASAMASEVTGA
ncbi:bacterioferritin-associated ferredoxin [Kitasatospora xanthocidica]|uniref:(2Fe-2S)-binding protein n=1 Tax=Kitasatospora xanthocidica TaxID=83382 RepID=UPI0036EE2355